ncbi:MAG: hypothetical protein NWE82_02280, partial [Candidatus Bathyarchaeota archaeon]|nr:hypothetical protein [Candidatus Bathyarchaeota archaeon]
YVFHMQTRTMISDIGIIAGDRYTTGPVRRVVAARKCELKWRELHLPGNRIPPCSGVKRVAVLHGTEILHVTSRHRRC